jgi:hypothetical protein
MRHSWRIAALIVIIGASINVAVGLMIAYRDPDGLKTIGANRPVRYAMHGERGWIVNIMERTGRTHVSALAKFDPVIGDPLAYGRAPYWSWTTHRPPPEFHCYVEEVGYGFPWRCLRIMHLRTGSGVDLLVGIPFDHSTPSRHWPTSVIWPGFIANTLLFAMTLWLLLFAPFMIRRTIRHRRGMCIHCGYDLRGAPAAPDGAQCPECGRIVRCRVAAHPPAARDG